MLNGEFFTVVSQCRRRAQSKVDVIVCTLRTRTGLADDKKKRLGPFSGLARRAFFGPRGTEWHSTFMAISNLQWIRGRKTRSQDRTRSASRWRTLGAVYTKSGKPCGPSIHILSHKIASRSSVLSKHPSVCVQLGKLCLSWTKSIQYRLYVYKISHNIV